MANPVEDQSPNDAPSEFIALGDLMDSEARTSDAPAPADESRSDLKTLRKLGYRYCNRCEQIVQPQIVSISRRSASMGFFKDTASGRTFAYVINCSGSMATRNALDVAKRELLASLDQLRPGARFSVIFYNLKIWVFTDPSGQYEMMPASVENKTWVQDQFAKVVPDGASAHSLALQNALDLKPDVVFFLTPADLMTKNQVDEILTQAGQTRIHVIELGQGPDLGKLSQRRRLATATGGTYRSIDVTKFPMPASGN